MSVAGPGGEAGLGGWEMAFVADVRLKKEGNVISGFSS